MIYIILAVVILLVAGSYLLPRHVTVERSVLVEASTSEIFPMVNSLKRGVEWSPWLKRDPDTRLDFTGPDAGVGAIMEWASDHKKVGSGRQEIVASVRDERVETHLDFGAQGKGVAWFALGAEGSATRLVWGLEADMGNSPIGRWMGLMMDKWVGADYEVGLANIKALAEEAS